MGEVIAPQASTSAQVDSATQPAPAQAGSRRWLLWGGGCVVALAGAAALVMVLPPVGGPDSHEKALGLNLDDRVLIQRGLLALGHDPGQGSGVMSAGTRLAIEEWQSREGMEATGYLTATAAEVLRQAGRRAVADSIQLAQAVAASAARADSVRNAQEQERREAEARAEAERMEQASARQEAARAEDARRRRPGRRFRDCGVCPLMVVLPNGAYMMGSPYTERGRYHDEGRRRWVTIGYELAVGVYEVTFAEWDACVAAGGCGGYRPDDHGWGRGRRPVINVRWEDAREYVAWLSKRTGENYRLLSGAEWEYAARGGTTTARYWGQSEARQCRYANGLDQTYKDARPDVEVRSVMCRDGYVFTAPVGTFDPNSYGLYDVLGNVFEWTEDCQNDSYENAPSDGRAWRTGDCSQRVIRGGSWGDSPRWLRSALHGWNTAGMRNASIGFRVARIVN